MIRWWLVGSSPISWPPLEVATGGWSPNPTGTLVVTESVVSFDLAMNQGSLISVRRESSANKAIFRENFPEYPIFREIFQWWNLQSSLWAASFGIYNAIVMRRLALLESLGDRVSTVGYGRNRSVNWWHFFSTILRKDNFPAIQRPKRFETAKLLPVNRSSMVYVLPSGK